jgi:hypothetical protein
VSLRIFISSNASAILRQVVQLPTRMAQAIARAMDKENQITVGVIQSEQLTGPRPSKIGVITNRLRGSIRAIKAIITGNTIESAIGSNVSYAGPLERGFNGTVTVRAHSRNIFSSHETGGGKSVDMKTGRLRTTKKKKISLLSGRANVKTHERKLNIPAHRYIEGTLERSTLAYSVAISRAIESAWNQGGSTA